MSEAVTMDRRLLRRWGPATLCIFLYCVAAYVAYAPDPPLGGNRIFSGCACGDSVQQAWYLAWTPYALFHGHNPFYATQLNYPFGVDLGSNTLMPLLGVLAAPFTLTIGPAGALVLMMRLGFALSAISMCFVLRRWTTWWPAAFLGGLIYAFSPYMLGQSNTHLHLLFVPLPPLFLALGDELLVRRRWSVRTTGLCLGLVAGLQYLIAAEVLAMCFVMAAVGLAFLALCHPHEVRAGAARLLGAGLWAVVPFLILAAYPIYTDFTGPGHIAGPTQPTSLLSSYHTDLIAPFVPTTVLRFGPASWFALADKFGNGNYLENGTYLGIPLVVALLCLVYWGRRVALVRFAGFMALVGFVLSLGPRLEVAGHQTDFPLPYAGLLHLPLYAGAVPARFSLYLQLFSAVLIGIGIDRVRRRALNGWWVRPKHAVTQLTGRSSLLREGLILGAVALAFVPLFPRFPDVTVPTNEPSFVADGRLASETAGSTLLTYPYTKFPWNASMLWQADSRMSFSLLGAYAILAGSNGHALTAVPVLDPPAMQTLFTVALEGGQAPTAERRLSPTVTLDAQLRSFLRRYRVGTIVVAPVGDAGLVLTDLADAIGAPPSRVADTYVWFRVQRDLQQTETRGVRR